jgi:hypothetical protein
MVLEALERAGGVAYLTRQAKANPTAFLGLVGKLLPRENRPEDNGRLTLGDLVEAAIAHGKEQLFRTPIEMRTKKDVPLSLPLIRG